jgi:hypothetical protein
MANATHQFRGTTLIVLAALAALATTHQEEAEAKDVDPDITAKHLEQFDIAGREASAAVAALPEDLEVEVNLWGIAGTAPSDKGKFGWDLKVADRPTPEPTG